MARPAIGKSGTMDVRSSWLTQYASYVPRLPSSIQSDAQTLVTTAQSAIATNNANLLGTQTVAQDSMAVQLYCGQNQ
jgi:hypothetical protein